MSATITETKRPAQSGKTASGPFPAHELRKMARFRKTIGSMA